ncbi:MAG: right-handed parallel beta-helix repeat-containing protein [Candidatus Hydrogenedentes bacterium]|nr:right-handed parallel beta-helix repeat-containing protein [Candidatus Hydrogenedentota bacterium]
MFASRNFSLPLLFSVLAALALPAPAIVYVSLNGDNSTGESWTTAFYSIEEALEVVAAGESIYVAEGVYVLGGSFELTSDLVIAGGFSGEEKGAPGQSDPDKFPTVLDGSGAAGSAFVCSDVTDVRIQGLTFKRFVGAGSGYARSGAIRVDTGADVEIHDCLFTNNHINGYGGGINIIGASAKIEDCVFKNNSAQEGGGVKVHQGRADLDDCVFEGNKANLIGGAYSGYYSETYAGNCRFIGNEGPYGGGVECHEGSAAYFVNCLFARNSASTQGGGLSFVFQANIQIVHCTIANNTTDGIGGGIFLHDSSQVGITSCIFSKNNSHAIFENSPDVDPDVYNCLFDGNPDGVYFNEGSQSIATASGPNGMNSVLSSAADDNLDGDPKFANPKLNDFHLTPGSPAIDNGYDFDGEFDDIDRDARPIEIAKAILGYDIGFDEYNPDAPINLIKPREGAKWKRGNAYTIEWESEGYTGSTMRLELLRNGVVVRVIAAKTPNTGSFEWTVPDNIAGKKGFTVRIKNVDDSTFKDESSEFRIVKP